MLQRSVANMSWARRRVPAWLGNEIDKFWLKPIRHQSRNWAPVHGCDLETLDLRDYQNLLLQKSMSELNLVPQEDNPPLLPPPRTGPNPILFATFLETLLSSRS